jgi:UDP-N-acetyl-2-amino-2-deoxyglucuronate dehydrogenase
LTLQRADVAWRLSTDPADLPQSPSGEAVKSFRSLTVDGEPVEFSDGFADLHTEVYREILGGGGCGIDAARPSVELAYRIRHDALGGA